MTTTTSALPAPCPHPPLAGGGGAIWGLMAISSEPHLRAPSDLESRYAPVLADLVHVGLLDRDDSGHWVLATTARRWLDARAARPRPPAEARVAVGLRCQACGESGLTTMADGRRLCSRCKVVDGYVDADPVPQLRPRRPT